MNYVDPTAWTPTSNPDTTGVKLGSLAFSVQTARKAWSLTAPSADVVRCELRPGDKWAGDGSAAKERSEVCGALTYPTGTPLNLAYGFAVEQGAANHAGWSVLGQFHGAVNDGNSPPFALELRGERMAVNLSLPSGDRYVWTDPANIVRGHEYALQIAATFDPVNGRLILLRDGVKIVDHAGPLGWANMGAVYWKQGIYRAASDTVIAARYRGLVITQGASVAPPVTPAPAPVPTVDPTAALKAQIAQLQADLAVANAKLAAVRAAAA